MYTQYETHVKICANKSGQSWNFQLNLNDFNGRNKWQTLVVVNNHFCTIFNLPNPSRCPFGHGQMTCYSHNNVSSQSLAIRSVLFQTVLTINRWWIEIVFPKIFSTDKIIYKKINKFKNLMNWFQIQYHIMLGWQMYFEPILPPESGKTVRTGELSLLAALVLFVIVKSFDTVIRFGTVAARIFSIFCRPRIFHDVPNG